MFSGSLIFTINRYVDLLVQVCERVQGFHPGQLSTPPNVDLPSFKAFSLFVDEVLCALALHDLSKLLKLSLKTEQQIFDRSTHFTPLS